MPEHPRLQREVQCTLPDWAVAWCHLTSGKLHASRGSQALRLLCGRALNEKYTICEVRSLAPGRPHCKTCWSSKSFEDE